MVSAGHRQGKEPSIAQEPFLKMQLLGRGRVDSPISFLMMGSVGIFSILSTYCVLTLLACRCNEQGSTAAAPSLGEVQGQEQILK